MILIEFPLRGAHRRPRFVLGLRFCCGCSAVAVAFAVAVVVALALVFAIAVAVAARVAVAFLATVAFVSPFAVRARCVCGCVWGLRSWLRLWLHFVPHLFPQRCGQRLGEQTAVLHFAFAFVAGCFSKVAEMGPNTMPKNLKNARQLTNNSKTRRPNRPQNALNGHQDCSGRRLCGRPAFGTLKIDTSLQLQMLFSRLLAPLGRF